MTISHFAIYVREGQLDAMTEWYLKALAPLGYKKHHDLRPKYPVIGIGARWPIFWLSEDPVYNAIRPPKEKSHIAFYGNSRQQARDFYDAAIKAGGTDNGPPGLRPEYTSTYYGAFVFDPEGRNIEVHCMTPAFMSEPSQWNIVMGAVGVVATVGLGYFVNYGGYLKSLKSLM